jgi:hypothetical protein
MGKCDSCDIELGAEPVRLSGRSYCCDGCSAGGPCYCTYEEPLARLPRNGHSDPLVASEIMGKALGTPHGDPGAKS